MNKMTYNKYFLCLKGIALLVVILGIMYYSKYSIGDSLNHIENSINQEVNKGFLEDVHDVEIMHGVDVEDKKYVCGLIDDNFAIAELTKGKNNFYSIDKLSYGTSFLEINTYTKDNENYLIAQCINSEFEISYITINVNDETYRIDLQRNGQYYGGYCKIKDEIKDKYNEISDVRFFDDNDLDITEEIPLSKGTDEVTGLVSRQVVVK